MKLGHHWPHDPRTGGAWPLAEAARYLPFGETRLRRLCHFGDIPEARLTDLGWRIPYKDLPAVHARYCHLPKADHQ